MKKIIQKALSLTVATWLFTGCSLSDFANWADDIAYDTLATTNETVMGADSPFKVEYNPIVANPDGIIKVNGREVKTTASKPSALSLDDVLYIALRNSRDYQNRKEALFTSALYVANERQSWNTPLLQGALAGTLGIEKPGGSNSNTTKTGAVRTNPSILQRFVNGGILTFGAAIDLATDFLGSDSLSIGSSIDANFTQPLLRGAWKGFAYEQQYRLERNFEFEVYAFHRYRQTFAANIVSRYYEVLRLRDRLENEVQNIKRLTETRDLTRIKANDGQVSMVQLDQAEQNLLSAKVRLTAEKQNYKNSVDQLKILIGLPTLANVEPAYPQALTHLSKFKPNTKDIPFTVDQAIKIALKVRPDVLASRSKVRDAKRNVEIAENNFLPQLDLDLGYSAKNPNGSSDPGDINFKNGRRYAKLKFNYPLNQINNRDAYRNSQIALSRAERDYSLFVDNLRENIRSTYRSLERSRDSYKIQLKNVEIAKSRRKLASLQQEQGYASARDVLEAEEALRNAQNGLTASLISYTTTRLRFLASLGMLQIHNAGNVSVNKEPVDFNRLNKRYPYTTGDFSKGIDINEKTNP